MIGSGQLLRGARRQGVRLRGNHPFDFLLSCDEALR